MTNKHNEVQRRYLLRTETNNFFQLVYSKSTPKPVTITFTQKVKRAMVAAVEEVSRMTFILEGVEVMEGVGMEGLMIMEGVGITLILVMVGVKKIMDTEEDMTGQGDWRHLVIFLKN